jgi:hypothetical protein
VTACRHRFHITYCVRLCAPCTLFCILLLAATGGAHLINRILHTTKQHRCCCSGCALLWQSLARRAAELLRAQRMLCCAWSWVYLPSHQSQNGSLLIDIAVIRVCVSFHQKCCPDTCQRRMYMHFCAFMPLLINSFMVVACICLTAVAGALDAAPCLCAVWACACGWLLIGSCKF